MNGSHINLDRPSKPLPKKLSSPFNMIHKLYSFNNNQAETNLCGYKKKYNYKHAHVAFI